MKKAILPIALLCCTFATSFAGDRDRRQDRDGNKALLECEIKSELLRRDNQSLSDRLQNCRGDRQDRERNEQILRENRELISRNIDLQNQVEKLKIDVVRLELELHPDRDGRFDLASSIRACSKIDFPMYAQECASAAKENRIQAQVIENCTKISNAYYQLGCVKEAGKNKTSVRQVEACTRIDFPMYAQECVQVAGKKEISPEVINSCVLSTSNSYYQLECVKSM
jgi:hypothetical protein